MGGMLARRHSVAITAQVADLSCVPSTVVKLFNRLCSSSQAEAILPEYKIK